MEYDFSHPPGPPVADRGIPLAIKVNCEYPISNPGQKSRNALGQGISSGLASLMGYNSIF